MPIYRFHIESPLATEAALERIRGLVRKPPAFWPLLKESWGRRPQNTPPFLGTVEGNTFRIYRDIRYRNSFLPRVRGQVAPSLLGTQIDVTMSLHPLVAVFMLFWLGAVGFGILTAPANEPEASLILLGMFIFGVALTLGAFYPEAIKARRLLEQSLGSASIPDGPGWPAT